ncbi:Uncharacterised protein [uncultured archaeon]|nr:Uncharacterised protein [uncultured archaeon]
MFEQIFKNVDDVLWISECFFNMIFLEIRPVNTGLIFPIFSGLKIPS